MNQVVAFEKTRKQRLDWKQEQEAQSKKRKDRARRDNQRTNREAKYSVEDDCNE